MQLCGCMTGRFFDTDGKESEDALDDEQQAGGEAFGGDRGDGGGEGSEGGASGKGSRGGKCGGGGACRGGCASSEASGKGGRGGDVGWALRACACACCQCSGWGLPCVQLPDAEWRSGAYGWVERDDIRLGRLDRRQVRHRGSASHGAQRW